MYVGHCHDHCVLSELSSLVSYGGIFERGSREYTLDDFYSIQLDKLERHTCLKHSGIVIPAEGDEISSDDDDDEGVESDEGGDSDSETRLGEDDAVLNKKLDDNQDAEEVDKPVDVLVSVSMILLCCAVKLMEHQAPRGACASDGVHGCIQGHDALCRGCD
jgi:hypothetical protein